MAIAHPTLWRPGTQQWIIAEALVAEDLHAKRAFAKHIRPMIVAQIEPMIFKGKRADGSYGPLAIEPAQCQRGMYRVNEVLKAILAHGWDREAGLVAAVAEEAAELHGEVGCGGCDNGECCGTCPCCPDPEPVSTGFDPAAEMRHFVAEVRRIRDWIAATDPDLDHLSYRPIKDGRKMIEAGIPAKACLHAMTLHWDDQSRVMAGIEGYDPASEFPGGVRAYLDTLVKARVHIYLYGEAGFGKSYWAEQLAERMDVPFGQTPCNEGVSPSWIVGKDTATGYKPSQLVELLPRPSVYLFDEIDRMDSNMAVLLNGFMANRTLANPVTGEDIVQHEDCVVVLAGNSLGEGSAKYVSANELDPSTRDRVRMGRVEIGYDREIEDAIAFG